MVGRKVALKLLEDHEKLKTTYNGRVKGLRKKTRELSTLCDVPALLISFGPAGTTCTWPEDPQEVCILISKFKACDMGRKRGRHLLRGPSTGPQVAKERKSRTSLEFSSISAALLQDHQLEKMTLREFELLYKSIDRASQMIEDKMKFLDDQKCLRGRHEMEHSEVIELNSVQGCERSSCLFTDSATELDQEFNLYTDQLDIAGNSMLPYEAIMSNTVVSIRKTNNATELGHQIIPYEVSPPLPDPISINQRSSSTSRNLTIEAAKIDHRCSNHLNNGQIENVSCPHKVICNEASELGLEQEAIQSDDQASEIQNSEDLCVGANSCQVISEQFMEQFPASMVATDHAGHSLQEMVMPSTSQAEYDLMGVDDPPCSYSLLSTPQLYLAEEMLEIDDMCYWISQHDDLFSLW